MSQAAPREILETADIEENLKYLERRDWELWSMALLIFTLFAAGMLVYVYSETNKAPGFSAAGANFLWLLIFGLMVLVVLLNVYLIDRKRSLMHLYRRFLLQAEVLHKERERAALDPLTQVYSRRFFDEIAPKEVLRCERADKPLSFVLVQLSTLEEINQRFGHLAADRVLQAVATVLRDTVRSSDSVFRFAGDKFMALLPYTPTEGASIAAVRLREHMRKHQGIQKLIGTPLEVRIVHVTYHRGDKLEAVLGHVEDSLETSRPGV